MAFDLAGMGRVAEGMSEMRDNMDRQRLNAQAAEQNAVKLRAMQQAELDRKRAYNDNLNYAKTMVIGADGVSQNPIDAPVGAPGPATQSDSYMPADAGGAVTTPLPPQNLPVGKPIDEKAKLAGLKQRNAGTMPGHFYNTAGSTGNRSIADDVLSGYDQAAPALMQKWKHGIKLTPEEQQILGNAPSTPPEVKAKLKFTPIARDGGTQPTMMAGGAAAAPTAPTPTAQLQPNIPATPGGAPASLNPADMKISSEVQAARDAKAGALTAQEYSDPATIQSDLAMIDAELGRRGLSTETRAVLQQEQRRLQNALASLGSGAPTGAPAAPTQVAQVPAAPVDAAPQALPVALDPAAHYATIASDNPQRDRMQRQQMAQYLMSRIQNTRDPETQAAYMQQLHALRQQDQEDNIFAAYAGAKVGSKQGWEQMAGLIHQQTGSQVGFHAQNGQIIMFQRGRDGRPEVIDQGAPDQMAHKLYGFLSPSMRAKQMEIAAKGAEAQITENAKLPGKLLDNQKDINVALIQERGKMSAAEVMANAAMRAAVQRAGVNPNEVKGLEFDPVRGETFLRTATGAFKLVKGQSDGDITSPDRFVPIDIEGFDTGEE